MGANGITTRESNLPTGTIGLYLLLRISTFKVNNLCSSFIPMLQSYPSHPALFRPWRSTLIICLLYIVAGRNLYGQQQEYKNISNLKDTAYVDKTIEQAVRLYRQQHRTDSAKLLLRHAQEHSLQLGYKGGLINVAYSLMRIDYDQQQFQQALRYADALIALCTGIGYKKELYTAYNIKALSYDALEIFDAAFTAYMETLKNAPDKDYEALAYNNIAVLMQNTRQYEKGLDYVNKALQYQGIPPKVKSLLYINKAKLYHALKDTVRPLAYLDSAYLYARSVNEQVGIRIHKMSFFNLTGAHDATLAEFSRLLPMLQSDSILPQLKAKAYMVSGDAFNETGDYKHAQRYLLQAETLSRFLLKTDARILQHFLSDLYYHTGQYKKAYNLHHAYHETEDSVRSKDIQLKVSELETQYRTVQKDKALAEQQVQIMKSGKQLYKNKMISVGIVAVLIILLLLLWLRYAHQKRKNQQLESAQEVGRLQALMEGEEKERHRLSHELHDGVNSSLAASSSYLHTLAELYPAMAAAPAFQKMKQMLQSASSEVRAVAHNLASPALVQNGLKQSIEDFCLSLFHKTTAIEVQVFGEERHSSETTTLLVYRLAQELLHNIHKHAHATEVIIMLGLQPQAISLTIEDNGIGLSAAGNKHDGIGLKNLQEKIHNQKGQITIESGIGKGTLVHITLPNEVAPTL